MEHGVIIFLLIMIFFQTCSASDSIYYEVDNVRGEVNDLSRKINDLSSDIDNIPTTCNGLTWSEEKKIDALTKEVKSISGNMYEICC